MGQKVPKIRYTSPSGQSEGKVKTRKQNWPMSRRRRSSDKVPLAYLCSLHPDPVSRRFRFLVTEGGMDAAGVFHKITRIDDTRPASHFGREVLAD